LNKRITGDPGGRRQARVSRCSRLPLERDDLCLDIRVGRFPLLRGEANAGANGAQAGVEPHDRVVEAAADRQHATCSDKTAQEKYDQRRLRDIADRPGAFDVVIVFRIVDQQSTHDFAEAVDQRNSDLGFPDQHVRALGFRLHRRVQGGFGSNA
jgi:hypothetical protein